MALRKILVASLTLAFACAGSALAAPIDETWLQEQVDATHDEFGLVALGAGVIRSQGEPIVAVAGKRWLGSDEDVQPGDAWHIGSNTKALTALLYSRLVGAGEAQWGATLGALMPNLASDMDAAWRDTPIEALFAHRAGTGQVGPVWLISRHADTAPLAEQRLETTRATLSKAPEAEPGTFSYSNLGYIIAGTAIEQITGKEWETALKEHVLEAPGSDWSDGWGFGPPQTGLMGTKKNVFGRSKAGRSASADNPSALGPAGTAHAPIASHLKLLREFLRDDSALIPIEQRERLLEPWPDESANYAMGWGIADDETVGRFYSHNGSNTMWLSRVDLIPSVDAVMIVNTNVYSDEAVEATRALARAIGERLSAPAD